jgi:hypothetical protein
MMLSPSMKDLRWLRSCAYFAILSLASLAPQSSTAQVASASDSPTVKLRIARDEISLTVPLLHPATKAESVQARVELLNPDDLLRATVTSNLELKPRQKQLVLKLPKPFDKLPPAELDEMHWLRLKFEVRAQDGEVLASGIEALRTPATEPFILTAAAGRMAAEGRWYQVPVHVKTNDGKALHGIRIEGTLTWDAAGGEQKLSAAALTNASGNGTLQFLIPKTVDANSGQLDVQAIRGLVTRSVQHDVSFRTASYLLLDTDKDIYQPGQTLHARVLRFDSARKAVANETLDLRVTDEENTLVSRQPLITDTFGVAHLEWTIPANALQGSYQIQVEAGDSEDDERRESATKPVRIYRYDLPNFRVSARPDRAYYLPAQNAEVAISAEYLFGKPVTRAKVRVVEEQERSWNFRKQEWESKEGQVQTGELDRDGHFTARFDLSEQHGDLTGENKYTKFQDVDLAAYVTDLTTGRTEQRRFTLRVTRDPIHVYAVEARSSSRKLLPSYYVSTFYADGTPARCKVRLSSFDGEHSPRHALTTVETNKYGLAKTPELKIPNGEGESDADDSLLLEATDQKGLTGTDAENIYSGDTDVLEVTASRAIHKTGEPLEVTLRSTKANLAVAVEVLREGAVLATQPARLRGGRGYLVFPYDPRFIDEITIVAYSLDEQPTPYSYLEGSRTVLYPKNRQLDVAVQFDKDEHRPGEDATARFTVRQPGQTGAESALGVKIVDTAVEERARTDSDFGQHSGWGWWRWSLWSVNSDAGFSGVSRDDLDRIDLTEPVPQDLDLVAEYILRSASHDAPELLNDEPDRAAEQVFSKWVSKQFETLEKDLQQWNERGKLPRNEAELTELAKEYGVDLPGLRDPWGTPYRFELRFQGADHFLKVISAGPDQQFGTSDDFTARETQRKFFLHYGNLLGQAVKNLSETEGHFIRDQNTLQAELLKQGVDFAALRDPWDEPYEAKFLIAGSSYVTQVISHGEDEAGKKQSAGKSTGETEARKKQNNGTVVWEDRVDYFLAARQNIDRVLTAHLHAGGAYPNNEDEFKAILRHAGVNLDELRDPWGDPYYIVFKNLAQYGDRVTIQQSRASGERTSEPVTLIRKEVRLMSPGLDHQPGTADDFQVASYSVLVAEQSANDNKPVQSSPKLNLADNTGAITGTVEDPSGAVIANAIVEATREVTGEKSSTQTDNNGRFELKDLKPGMYRVASSSKGFQSLVVAAVPVQSGTVTEISFRLSVGWSNTTVEVSGVATQVETSTSYSVAGVRSLPSLGKPAPQAAMAVKSGVMSTPRLRQDFPETMLWEPALVTDRRGKARLNFKLADNITTWKLTAIASTRNGELGRAEKDLRAFQPFFVEHDPPRILTQGDEIAYPLVLRNYLDHAQTLTASIKPETWFTLLGPAEVPVKVEAGDAARAVFRYRAVAAVTDGKQQVSAANTEISDAEQKPVDVHPFGRPTSVTAGTVFAKEGSLALQIPEAALADSLRARVKIYPNLLAHVVENLEAGLERPHGCGEQTISSTYPSLLVTEIYAQSAKKPALALKAQRYLAAGYERLLRYQDLSGGFTYWGHGDPDLSLTAYALEFLHHAARFIAVDDNVIQRAEKWILEQQSPDGAWRGRGNKNDNNNDNYKDALLQTVYVSQMLIPARPDQHDQQEQRPELRAAQQKALLFLSAHHDLIDEPYIMASYALAAKAVGNEKSSAEMLGRLRSSVHYENGTAYWVLERNTPFYGWGFTGRLETTALVLRALASAGDPQGSDAELIRQGLLFLLRNEDKDGMWYSGQTTVHVLKTLLQMVAIQRQGPAAKLTVQVNGADAATVDLPEGQTVAAPIEVDVTKFVKPGENQVKLATSGEGMMSVQFVADSYLAWPADSSAVSKSVPNAGNTLKFTVTYSATSATTDDKVECRVKAERVGYRGYGMMLAEIGLPPGADVDRETLERALISNDSVYRYDVLPDRVILYIWPYAGGSDLAFQFRPRFAMQAESAPSLLYDYYNPEASVSVKPSLFHVTQGKQDPTSATASQ